MAASIAQFFSHLPCWTSDALLLQRYVHQRDEAAFAALVARHGNWVLRLCRRILGDVHAAEDAFQATFLILAQKAQSLKQPDALPAWLYGVARRVALKARGQSHRRAAAPLNETLPDSRPDPLTQLSVRELLDILDEEVQRLPAAQRSAFVLCCLEGHTQEEAARMLGWTPGSVKGRLERGRQRLQARLQRRGIALPAALSLVLVMRDRAAARVPVLLLQSTVRAAVHGSSGSTASALAHSVLHAMFLPKLAGAMVVALTLALAASTAAVLVYRGLPVEAPDDKTPAVPVVAKNARVSKPPVRTDVWGDPLPPHAVARLGSIRLYHGAVDVEQVVFSPDGKLVVSTSNTTIDGGDNKLWEVQTGRELPLAEHLRYAFVFTANGKLLGAGKESNRLWDLATGKAVSAEGIDIDAVRKRKDLSRREALSPDGTILVVWGENGVRLRDARTRKELPPLQGGRPHVRVCRPCFSPDGKLLAAETSDPLPEVSLWDVATRKVVRRLQGKDYQIFDIAFSPDGKILAAADGGGVTLWDVRTGMWLHDPGHTYCVRTLAFTPDEKTLLSGAFCYDRSLRLWDPFTGRLRGKWETHEAGINAIVITPDGKQVISANRNGAIRLWDLASGKEIGRIGDDRIAASDAALSANGKLLATGGKGVQLWDLATRRKVRSFGRGTVIHLAFSPDGTKLASSASEDATVRVWNVANGEELRSFRGVEANGDIAKVGFSSDGQTLAISNKDGTILLWDVSTGKELRRLGQPLKPGPRSAYVLGALTFSPDGRTLAAGYSDQIVRLLEVATGKERARFQGHRRGIFSLAFSPDGRLLASGSWDRTIMVWDVTGRVCPENPARIVLDAQIQERLWADLAESDAAKAYQAMQVLLGSEQTVALLKKRLRPDAATDAAQMNRLVADLDSDDFAVREKATQELTVLGDRAESVLRTALPKASAEARRRIEDILAQIGPASSADLRRGLRAVEVLERLGSIDAQQVLRNLAEGDPHARLTREAKSALERLAKSRR